MKVEKKKKKKKKNKKKKICASVLFYFSNILKLVIYYHNMVAYTYMLNIPSATKLFNYNLTMEPTLSRYMPKMSIDIGNQPSTKSNNYIINYYNLNKKFKIHVFTCAFNIDGAINWISKTAIITNKIYVIFFLLKYYVMV
ncbi:hypothetical protein C0J52_07655 [Blattella germanica]|nr:hypothetical protein C0J52_07655 [Blattella germanica]